MAKAPRIPATVGPFVFAYPHLTSPDSEGKFADNKYKVDGICQPGSRGAKSAEAAVKDALKQLGITPKGAEIPLKKETAKNEKGKREPTGSLMFRCKSQYAPGIADASGKPIPAKALKTLKIGAGSEGLLQGYFSSYTRTEKIKDADGNVEEVETPGISFTLQGVQLIKLVKGGGAGEANFAAYDGGGFSYEGGDEDDGDIDLNMADDSSDDEGDLGGLDI
jgi:hypothetical protein